MTIKEISNEPELKESIPIIRDSFVTVADELNLTEENCPTNPAFITLAKLHELKEKGVKMFGLYHQTKLIGFVAIEKANHADTIFYMEKLAVLPEFRHQGLGRKLMDFVFEFVKNEGGQKVSIAVINENTTLKNWYQDYGFGETGTKKFSHLPFTVCFMEKKLIDSL